MNFAFDYYSIHVSISKCECVELICIVESHYFGIFLSLC